MNVVGALQHSCNDFFYEVGYRLGQDSNGNYDSDTGLEKLAKYAPERLDLTRHQESKFLNHSLRFLILTLFDLPLDRVPTTILSARSTVM